MIFRNHTPHAIALIVDGGTRILEPVWPPARVLTKPSETEELIDGVIVRGPGAFDRIDGLPDRQDGVLVIVSQITALFVAATMEGRDDVVFPATGRAEGSTRDAGGTLGVSRLVRAC